MVAYRFHVHLLRCNKPYSRRTYVESWLGPTEVETSSHVEISTSCWLLFAYRSIALQLSICPSDLELSDRFLVRV